MKLYRAKIPVIAAECIDDLVRDGDIELRAGHREDAVRDLEAVMNDHIVRDNQMREEIKDRMARDSIPYDQFGRTWNRIAEERGHAVGDEVERYFARQFAEYLLISPFVDEVFAEDRILVTKLRRIIVRHDVDESKIVEEAKSKIKNVAENTVEYEIALRGAIRDVRRRIGLV